jgi:hypothetical protein
MPSIVVHDHNSAVVSKAIRYVRDMGAQIADVHASGDPRFTVNYEGFGSGGMAGVTPEGAIKFLIDLTSARDPHYRYDTRIEKITVKITVPDADFTA